MEKCKVYKGLNSPCKVKGLFVHHFYTLFGASIFGGAILCFDLVSLTKVEERSGFIVKAIIVILILFLLYTHFHHVSNQPKRKINKKMCTVSNRELFTALNKKKHG